MVPAVLYSLHSPQPPHSRANILYILTIKKLSQSRALRIPALQKQRQVDFCEFEDSFEQDRESSSTARATQKKPCSKTKPNQQQNTRPKQEILYIYICKKSYRTHCGGRGEDPERARMKVLASHSGWQLQRVYSSSH